MLKELYKITTPWAKANSIQIFMNRLLGVLANIMYPFYFNIKKLNNCMENNSTKIIVSLTSFPARIDKVHLCIYSILNQSKKADKVFLWLAKEQFEDKTHLPKKLLELEKKGLEIKFCDDLKSYKKIFYVAQEYIDSIIITADDDTLYPEDWIENLINTYEEYPNHVVCYRAHLMKIEGNSFAPYLQWGGLSKDFRGPSELLLPVGVGGVLYPPKYFEDAVFDANKIRELCPTADDLWLKAIGLKKHCNVIKVNTNSKEWFTLKNSQNNTLMKENVGQNLNDVAMKKLVEFYQLDVNNLK